MTFKAQVLAALQSINIDASNLSENETFGNDIGMDSQEMVEFYFALEKKLNVNLPEDFLNRSMTIKEAINKLEQYMAVEA